MSRNPNNNRGPAGIPHRDSVNQLQLSNLLSVYAMSLNALMPRPGWGESSNEPPELPKESRAAAEVTFWAVCDRLTKIMNDDKRWDMELQAKMEDNILKIQQAQLTMVENQSNAIREINSPSARYKPTLYQLRDGNWAAILGELDHPNAMVGLGKNPQDAFQNFDKIFRGELPTFMIDWLRQRETAANEGKPLPPLPDPNDQITNQSSPAMDEGIAPTGEEQSDSSGTHGGSPRRRRRKSRNDDEDDGSGVSEIDPS